jgi:hypothetical protein
MIELMTSLETPELEPAATAPAELREADFRGCRWIAGEPTPLHHGMYCCEPTAPNSAWCARHRGIVWSYRKPRLGRLVRPVQVSYAQNASLGLDTP